MHLVRLNRGGQFYDWICPSGAASMPRPGPVTNPAAIENSRCGPGDSLYPDREKSPEAVRSGLGYEPISPCRQTISSPVRDAICGLTPSVPLPGYPGTSASMRVQVVEAPGLSCAASLNALWEVAGITSRRGAVRGSRYKPYRNACCSHYPPHGRMGPAPRPAGVSV